MEPIEPPEPRTITLTEFRRLLADLRDSTSYIHVQVNQEGKGWMPNFMSVIMITRRGAIFNDEATDEFVNVSDLTRVKEFMLNKPIHGKTTEVSFEMNDCIRISMDSEADTLSIY